jgi:hypothetical protein
MDAVEIGRNVRAVLVCCLFDFGPEAISHGQLRYDPTDCLSILDRLRSAVSVIQISMTNGHMDIFILLRAIR